MNAHSHPTDPKARQYEAFEERYGTADLSRWEYLGSDDPAMRYHRDLHLNRAVDRLLELTHTDPADWRVLVICGGAGGEATYLRARGFTEITTSDYSDAAVAISAQREPSVPALRLDAEDIDFPDDSFDLVLVHAGLHHLPRPVLGFTEMLRVARKAVIVSEPHTGVIARAFGQEFEEEQGEFNFVFRWNRQILEQATKSYVLQRPTHIEAIRIIHHWKVYQLFEKAFRGRSKAMLAGMKAVYGPLSVVAPRLGNTMVGLVIFDPDEAFEPTKPPSA